MSKILDSRCLPQGKSGWPRCNAISLTHVDGAGPDSWSSGASGLAQVLEHLAGGFGLWIVRRPA
jgi:hypothetical protein